MSDPKEVLRLKRERDILSHFAGSNTLESLQRSPKLIARAQRLIKAGDLATIGFVHSTGIAGEAQSGEGYQLTKQGESYLKELLERFGPPGRGYETDNSDSNQPHSPIETPKKLRTKGEDALASWRKEHWSIFMQRILTDGGSLDIGAGLQAKTKEQEHCELLLKQWDKAHLSAVQGDREGGQRRIDGMRCSFSPCPASERWKHDCMDNVKAELGSILEDVSVKGELRRTAQPSTPLEKNLLNGDSNHEKGDNSTPRLTVHQAWPWRKNTQLLDKVAKRLEPLVNRAVRTIKGWAQAEGWRGNAKRPDDRALAVEKERVMKSLRQRDFLRR